MHHLEETLFFAIAKKNLDSIDALISQIDTCDEANFEAIDAQGNTLLHHAIRCKSWQAFEALFDHLEHEPEIIFKPNQDGLTLFSFAISRLEYRHAQSIFERLEKKVSLETLITSFFLTGEGSPFHLETAQVHPDFFDFLITKLRDHPDFITILNHLDRKGNTALHRAARAKNIKACALLLNSGVDFYQKNKAGDRALDSLEENHHWVCEVFKQLDRTKKKAILDYYRNKILLNGMDRETKTLYLKLASLLSLQEKMRAELEFNQQVPLFADANPQALFPSEILYSNMIPFLYRLRLLLAEDELNLARPLDDDLALNNEEQHLQERISFLAVAQARKLRTAIQKINPEQKLAKNHPLVTLSRVINLDLPTTYMYVFVVSMLLGMVPSLLLMIALPQVHALIILLATFIVGALVSLALTHLITFGGRLFEKALDSVDKKTHSEKFEGLEKDLFALKDTLSVLEENPNLQEAMVEIDKQIQALKEVDLGSAEQIEKILEEINSCLIGIGEVSLTQLNGINFSMVKGDEQVNDLGIDGSTDVPPQASTSNEQDEAPRQSRAVFRFFKTDSELARHHVESLKDALSLG